MPLRRAVGAVSVPVARLDAVERHVTKVRTRALAFARALRKPPSIPKRCIASGPICDDCRPMQSSFNGLGSRLGWQTVSRG